MITQERPDTPLAAAGRKPVVNDPDNTAWRWPVFDAEDKAAVAQVLERPGRELYAEMALFEKELCEYFDCRYALSTNNGTAAIHSAMHAIGLAPGDEIITPSYTYWATSLAARLCGAIPIFADVQPDSANIDPADIARKITPRTKAIIVTHLWGMPCEMAEIVSLAHRYNLKVIEDASHAHGAEYHGRKIGTWGDAGCFSMQASKLLPSIEGGFLLTNDSDLYAKACALGHYTRVPADHDWANLNSTGLGYKYRIHPCATALARVRLRKLDEQNRVINRRVEKVIARLEQLHGLRSFPVPSGMRRVYYQFEMIYDERATGIPKQKVIDSLMAEGARVAHERYPLQHEQPVYRRSEFWTRPPEPPASLPACEEIIPKIIQLPTFATCKERVVDEYIAAFEKVWANLKTLAV